jgi:hypothetical protein
LATTAVTLEPQSRAVEIDPTALLHRWSFRTSIITGLALFAVALEGYHPYAEDGGLYAAGVERLLDPALFPHWSSFVLAPTRVSAFAPAVAALVRGSHFSFSAVLLLIHLATIWATLYAAWGIAEVCWQSVQARVGAVAVLACWLGLPVAGTSLQIMDPYVTARSVSTPCTLFALLCVLRATSGSTQRKYLWWILSAASLALAFAMHPLMAGYGLAATCLLVCLRSARRSIQFVCTISCWTAAIGVAALMNYRAAPESAAYVRAALTRSYWFPGQWTWYELIGLIAPLAILAAYSGLVRRSRRSADQHNSGIPGVSALAGMATVLGTTAILVAVLFARPESHSHLVARLQPLRAFQIVYIVMILSLGALLGEYVLGRRIGRWIAAVLLLGMPIFVAQRATYPSTRHIQISEADDENPWVQSFAWARTHTPKDALFALDPDYIHAPGEDGQCFRAIAQRSALPDFSKDGGEASVAPQLAELWQYGLHAQRNLGTAIHLYRNSSDASALRAVGVSWVILRAKARTDLSCPYSNTAAKVCRIS